MEAAHRRHPDEDEDFFPTNFPMSAEYEDLMIEPIPMDSHRLYVPAMWHGPLNCVSRTMPTWLLPLLVWPYISAAKQSTETAFVHATMAFHNLLHWERAFGTGRWYAKFEMDLQWRFMQSEDAEWHSRRYQFFFYRSLCRVTAGFRHTWNGGRKILRINLNEMQPPAPPPHYRRRDGEAPIWWGTPGTSIRYGEGHGLLWLPTFYERNATTGDDEVFERPFANEMCNWTQF